MDMAPPKGYLAMGSSMQKLPGGATAVVHSLQQPDLSSVLSDEPDMTGCGTSEVSLPTSVYLFTGSENVRAGSSSCCMVLAELNALGVPVWG